MADDLCPYCGNPTDPSDEGPICTPLSCAAWVVEATFDKETRTWVPSVVPVDVVDR